MKCSWGCNQDSTYQLKSGKYVCQPKHNVCPALIAKRQSSLKKTYEHGYIPPSFGRKMPKEFGIAVSKRMKGREPWNKGKSIGNSHCWQLGKTKETDERLKLKAEAASISIKQQVAKGGDYSGYFSKSFDRSKNKNMGGYRKGGGRGKSGWYKGFWCDSSWELAFLLYHLDNNIPITRNSNSFNYEYEGKTRKYYPDFIVNNDFVEIKGYTTKQWEAKLSQFPHTLRIISSLEITPFLEYAQSNYGDDYVSLYEKREIK